MVPPMVWWNVAIGSVLEVVGRSRATDANSRCCCCPGSRQEVASTGAFRLFFVVVLWLITHDFHFCKLVKRESI